LITRESAAPKPDPAGIHQLLSLWSAAPNDAVMIGDYDHDLTAGRRAGTHTVYVDPLKTGHWSDAADMTIQTLDELYRLRD
jgi:phosphoglycolate phosphatase-like HAD superfamily hydrolase